MKNWHIAFLLLLSGYTSATKAQVLKPGFDREEYIETLKINQKAHQSVRNWEQYKDFPAPQDHVFAYRSPRVAFDNIWDLWIHKQKRQAVIAVQGSIQTEASFLANLYAAMIPASGTLQLDKQTPFRYHLSDNPNAAIHVGWFTAMAYLSPSVKKKIDSCYILGIKDYILTGHSQGGGITFLLTAYLYNLQREGRLPSDIRFKTYCSAGPKPGNLWFAYDYEHLTQGGWAFNVVNTADWVPDVPFSVQTTSDFTAVNPFRHARQMIRKQKFPKNIALRHVYNRLNKPSEKARRNYQRFLGKMLSRQVKKTIPDFTAPQYYQSNYYVRTGNTIVLYPDSAYYKLFSNDPGNPDIWQHHLPKQYLFLTERMSRP